MHRILLLCDQPLIVIFRSTTFKFYIYLPVGNLHFLPDHRLIGPVFYYRFLFDFHLSALGKLQSTFW